MRKRFDPILTLGITPISDIIIPINSRDKISSILLGLQFIYKTPELSEKVFTILEDSINSDNNNTGRPGMDLWYILVLGVIRVGMNYSFDDICYAANHDRLLRSVLGIDDFLFMTGNTQKEFHYRTIHENISKFNPEILEEINKLLCEFGEKEIKKKENEKLLLKADSYAFETDVHFPTDLSLAFDAARKCIEFADKIHRAYSFKGWRKHEEWKSKIKNQKLVLERIIYRGKGVKKEEQIIKGANEYIKLLQLLSIKVENLILDCYNLDIEFIELEYFYNMLDKHIDLIDRRLLKKEKIDSKDKTYSLFQPYTEWLSKGKVSKKVELGIKVVITTDQYSLIRDYRVMEKTSDSQESVLLADRLLSNLGEDKIETLSFDRGFYSKENKELLSLYFTGLNMPKKGKKNKAETEEEREAEFVNTRKKHSAIESNINCLEHHGLDKCPDKSLHKYKVYVGLGVISYNLHKIGNALKEKVKKRYLKTG